MADATVCESKGCLDDAKWQAFVVCHNDAGETLFEGDTNTVMCDDHKNAVTVETFMDDSQYLALCETFDTLGRPRPPRKLITLEFREI